MVDQPVDTEESTPSNVGAPTKWTLFSVAVLIAAFVSMSEIDRIIGRSNPVGEGHSVRGVTGPLAFGNTDAWEAWGSLAQQLKSTVDGLIFWHLVFDLVFLVVYVSLLRTLLSHASTEVPRQLLTALIALELLESLSIILVITDAPLRGTWVVFVALLATLKWLSVAGIVVALARDEKFRNWLKLTLQVVGRALWLQRLSGVVIVALVVLTLLPLPGPLDQMSDAVRRWTDGGAGARYAAFALMAYLLVSWGVWLMGRQRTKLAVEVWGTRKHLEDVRTRLDKPGDVWIWLLAPSFVAAVAVLLSATNPDLLDASVAALFVAVPTALVACSLILRWAGRNKERPRTFVILGAVITVGGLLLISGWLVRDDPKKVWFYVGAVVLLAIALVVALNREIPRPGASRPVVPAAVEVVGDVVALAVLVAAALVLVRSFTAPVILSWTGPNAVNWGSRLLLGLGWMATILIPLIAWSTERGIDRDVAVGADDTKKGARQAVTAAIVAVAFLASLVAVPTAASGWFGVLAVAVIGLGAWAVLIGLLIATLQERRPLEVFQLFKMTANPVLSLTLALLLTVGLVGGDPDLHVIRTNVDDTVAAPSRQSLDGVFDDWLGTSTACDVATGSSGGPTMRPMVLVAASGGGIRAAVWTASAMAAVSKMGECGPAAVVVSSGVSGGSVGLAIAGLMGDRSDDIITATSELAEPDALAVGVSGTVVGDPFATLTGIRAQVEGGLDWHDRAGLMEMVWESKVPDLNRTYDTEIRQPVGALILNSTAAQIQCRLTVSQIELGAPDAGAGPECSDADQFPAASVDFHATVAGCYPDFNWSTAAMMSARFPIVTPSGRVIPYGESKRRCSAQSLQMIDGGYAEGSGLGTIAELAPALAALVRDHNVEVEATQAGSFVVPVVVYLDDEPGSDRSAAESKSDPEFLVPITGYGTRGKLASTDAWIQRIHNAFTLSCAPEEPDESLDGEGTSTCTSAMDKMWADLKLTGDRSISGSVILTAPPLMPAVEVPLGWTLSGGSVSQLHAAAGAELDGCETVGNADVSRGLRALSVLLCEDQ